MGFEDFWLESNNGKKYSLKDLKDVKQQNLAKNPKLQKFFKLFDFDNSGSIETKNKNGQNEWQSIFIELKQAAIDNNLSNEEFTHFISQKMPNEDLKLNDLNELLDIATNQTQKENTSQSNNITFTRTNDIVTINIEPNTTILVKNVNENGQFADEDFIEMRTIDSDGKETIIKRAELGQDSSSCIVATKKESEENSLTTIYGTNSYYIYELLKNEDSLKALEFYTKGNDEYYVQYTQDGNTVTHAKNGDTIESLIKKFGFKNRDEFDILNPTLKGKKYPNVSESIVIPGHYHANDKKIIEQGTVYGEQYEYIQTVERRNFKEKHLQNLDENIFNKLNNLNGLELSDENLGLYFTLNSFEKDLQNEVFNKIKELVKEGKTVDEIKTYFLSDPRAPKYTTQDGTEVSINLFNEFAIKTRSFIGTQKEDTPLSIKAFIKDVMGLDITKGEGKELYDKLSNVSDPYVVMDINEMFSNIYHRTTKEYKDWHSQQLAKLNSTGWKNDTSIKTTGEREYLKEYPPISKETALEMYRAVINKMTAKDDEVVTTKYDKFIEDNKDVYLREFATFVLFSLHQSGAGNLQSTTAHKDILNPSKYLLSPIGNFYDKKGKEIYQTMMADCYKGNKKFNSILKCYTTGHRQSGVPFDKQKMKYCMEVLQNPDSTEAQKKKALENAFGYQVVNAAQDLIGVANFVDGAAEIALMIYGTGLIGKGLGKLATFASGASNVTKASNIITSATKGLGWGERLTQIGLSATNFAIWEGARYTVNYYTNDIDEDFSYTEKLGTTMAHGASFGAFAGFWGQFITQPILKRLFKAPATETVSKEASAYVSKSLKGSSKFTSKQVLESYSAGQQKAMSSLGQKVVGFVSDVIGFSVYEIGHKLIVGNDEYIKQILHGTKKYTSEEIDILLKKPEELKKALQDAGCDDKTIKELTEIDIEEILKGQLKTLLSFKAIGQIVYMHRTGKLPPSALNFGKEKPLEFEAVKENGKTIYKVKYPNGTMKTATNINEVVALSNMHYQDITLYKPIEEVLKKDGKMELDEGITLLKNAEGYSVTFKDGTKVEAKDLKNVMTKAQAEYTIMEYEAELTNKGQIKLPNEQIVTFDKETNLYKTIIENNIEVKANSFKELLQVVQKKTICQSIEKSFTGNIKAIKLDETSVIVKQEDGTYRMVVIKDGFPKEFNGNSIEEVLNKSVEKATRKNTPQGMTAEGEELIQRARKDNPATVIEDKVHEQWQQHDLGTHTPETDAPAIIFKNGKAVINEDLAKRQIKETTPVISDEVTSLIFKGKLNTHLTKRYEEMGKVFEEIAQKNSAHINELVRQNPKDKQAVASGIVKILAKELGMEGFEPPIVLEDTNGADGYADWPNGRIVINKGITRVKDLTSIISHEFVHMLQFRDILAQYGEQGLRDLINNDKSIPDDKKESYIKNALENDYNNHLLQSYNFQAVQEGTVEYYLRRIYKDEFTNTAGTDNMHKYTDQASEREAYHLGSERLGQNTEGLNDVFVEPSSLQERMAKIKAQLKDNSGATSEKMPTTMQKKSTDEYEIDEFGQIHKIKISIEEATNIINQTEISDYDKKCIIYKCTFDGKINYELFTKLIKLAKEDSSFDTDFVDFLRDSNGFNPEMMKLFTQLYEETGLKNSLDLCRALELCTLEGVYNPVIYEALHRLKTTNKINDECLLEILSISFKDKKFDSEKFAKYVSLIEADCNIERIYNLENYLRIHKIDAAKFYKLVPIEIIEREMKAGREDDLPIYNSLSNEELNTIKKHLEGVKDNDDITISSKFFIYSNPIREKIYIEDGYSEELANLFSYISTTSFDKTEVTQIYQLFKNKTSNTSSSAEAFKHMIFGRFLDRIITPEKTSLKDLYAYFDSLDINKIIKEAPIFKEYSLEQQLDFIEYHYRAGNTNFTKETLSLPKDLTKYLTENYVDAKKMKKLLTIFPATDRFVGKFPENWTKDISAERQGNIDISLQKSIDAFSEIVSKYNKEADQIEKSILDNFAQEISSILGKEVTISRLGSGEFGTGYKLSVEGSEDVVLKVFHSKVEMAEGNVHGRHAEPQTGLFVNEHSTDFVKMFCGKVAGESHNDGYIITQFLGENSIAIENANIKNGYTIKSGDAAETSVGTGHNVINGKIIDFGAIIIEKNN